MEIHFSVIQGRKAPYQMKALVSGMGYFLPLDGTWDTLSSGREKCCPSHGRDDGRRDPSFSLRPFILVFTPSQGGSLWPQHPQAITLG